MSDFKRERVIVFATIYECIASIFEQQMSIEEMRKMIEALRRYTDDREKRLNE